MGPAEALLDRALARLKAFDSELANGFTSHAPMVAEALVALDRGDALERWLDRYLAGARPARAACVAIDDDAWEAFLGESEREPAWQATFERALAGGDWRGVLSLWLPRLAPGFAAAAAHGPIRAAHAARALARAAHPLRLSELAGGLALWAASYQALPGEPRTPSADLDPMAALGRVPLVSASRRRNQGAITTALTVLETEAGFPEAVSALDRSGPWGPLSLAVAEAFAQMFIEQVSSPLEAIVFTHAVTGVAAARRLGRFADDVAARSLVVHAWQTGCGLYATYGKSDRNPVTAIAPSLDNLIDAAVAHGDEHVIKLTEACVDFHALTGADVFLVAAEHGRATIPSPTGQL